MALHLILPAGARCGAGPCYKVSIMSLFKPTRINVYHSEDQPLILKINGEPLHEYFVSGGGHFDVSLGGGGIIVRTVDINGKTQKEKTAELSSVISFSTQDTNKNYNGYSIDVNGKARKEYKGILEIKHLYGDFLILLSLAQEELVASVTASEIGGYSSTEALKAQAVLARTFLVVNKERHKMESYDFCDTTHCQFFKEREEADSRVMKAVEETADEIVTYGGYPVRPYYFSTCGGYTALAGTVWGMNLEYISQVKCDYCADSELYRYERSIKKSALSRVLLGKDDKNFDIRVEKRDSNDHWIDSIKIYAKNLEYSIKGDKFKTLVGSSLGWGELPSASFKVKKEGDSFIFSGKGSGHGVGLCQAGADKMAKLGFGYKKIIEFYFPEVKVEIPEKGLGRR